jgi:type I restriction enzyme R subunit
MRSCAHQHVLRTRADAFRSGKDDEKALYDLLGNKDERKKFDTQFKKAESNFKISIVVDMWLTGFDVPFLDTMLTPSHLLGRACGPALQAAHLARTPSSRFIDKPVQRHNLIQTISRVNRKFEIGDRIFSHFFRNNSCWWRS